MRLGSEQGCPVSREKALAFLNEEGRAFEMWKHMMQAAEGFIVSVRANTLLTDLVRSGLAAITAIDGMTTVPASSRIGLRAKWKNSEGARQVSLPNGMTLAGT